MVEVYSSREVIRRRIESRSSVRVGLRQITRWLSGLRPRITIWTTPSPCLVEVLLGGRNRRKAASAEAPQPKLLRSAQPSPCQSKPVRTTTVRPWRSCPSLSSRVGGNYKARATAQSMRRRKTSPLQHRSPHLREVLSRRTTRASRGGPELQQNRQEKENKHSPLPRIQPRPATSRALFEEPRQSTSSCPETPPCWKRRDSSWDMPSARKTAITSKCC